MQIVKRPYGVALNDATGVSFELVDPATGQLVQPALADGAAAATGLLTTTANFANNETVVLGLITYTAKAALTGGGTTPYEFLIGANAAASVDNLVSGIMRTAGEGSTYGRGTVRHPDVSAARSGNNLSVTGPSSADGNLIATTETCANASFGAATLTGGADSDVLVRRDWNREESAFADVTIPTGSRVLRWKPSIARMRASRLEIVVKDLSNPKLWLDQPAVIETTGHHRAQHPEGVIFAGFLTAVAAGTMTLADALGYIDGYPRDTSLRSCWCVVRQSDAAADIGAFAWVSETGFDGATNGNIVLGLNWNRTPTGTAANIEVAFYSDFRQFSLNGVPQTGDVYPLADTEIASIISTLATISSRIPAALVGGRIDANLGSLTAAIITAAAFAAGAIDANAVADNALDLAAFAADFKARLLAAASILRMDQRETTGGLITVAAGAHTTILIAASDAPNGTRLKGRLGEVVVGSVKRVIRFTSDAGASGVISVADTAGAALPAALVNADQIQY